MHSASKRGTGVTTTPASASVAEASVRFRFPAAEAGRPRRPLRTTTEVTEPLDDDDDDDDELNPRCRRFE